MGMTILTTTAVEGSTFVVTATFYDEEDQLVTPTSITWSLVDQDGTIINGRDDVEVAVPADSIKIVLSGDDLAVSGTNTSEWLLIINAVYDSTNGSDLPLVAVAQFKVAPAVA